MASLSRDARIPRSRRTAYHPWPRRESHRRERPSDGPLHQQGDSETDHVTDKPEKLDRDERRLLHMLLAAELLPDRADEFQDVLDRVEGPNAARDAATAAEPEQGPEE